MKIQKKLNGDLLFMFFNDALLLLGLIIVLYPLIYIVSSSFSSTGAVMAGKVWLFPVEPSLEGYKAVFRHQGIMRGYANTFFYTFIGTIVNVIFTILAAYPLSRKDFKPRKYIMLIFAFTMIFSGGLIPQYILISKLGLINTRAVMILPTAMSVWNVIITRTYFQSNISKELLEASQLDGCSDIKFLLRILLPLSGAVIAVITLFYAIGHWNAFFQAFIYLNDKNLFPLQVILREILVINQTDLTMIAGADLKEMETREGLAELIKYSLIIVASVPVLCLYPFVQKFFVKGVMIGAIKA